MGASLQIRNMNWTLGQRELIQEAINDELRKKEQRFRESVENSNRIRAILGQTEFQEWWESTPESNTGYYQATLEKLAELKKEGRL